MYIVQKLAREKLEERKCIKMFVSNTNIDEVCMLQYPSREENCIPATKHEASINEIIHH